MNRSVNLTQYSAGLQKWAGRPQTLTLARNLLVLLFLLWACFTLARLFWLLVPEPDLPAISNASPRNGVVAANPNQTANRDLSELLGAELFGALDTSAPVEETPVQPEITNAVETKLNLILRGVIKSSVAENSEAIIAHGREEKVFRVGDKLPGGNRVKLVQVDSDRVILDNAGRTEALSLYDKDSSNSSASSGSSRAAPRRLNNRASASSADTPQPVAIGSRSTGEDDDQPERRVIKKMPSSLAEVIKFSVARDPDSGSIMGYKIRPGRDREAFASLGLVANDVVTEINGIVLDSSGSVTKVYQEMRAATSATVTLLRDGQSMQLTLELDTKQ